MKFFVIGAGAWGTAMAVHLARGGHGVVLGCRDEKKAEAIRKAGENAEHLKGVKLEGVEVCGMEKFARGAGAERSVGGNVGGISVFDAVFVALPSYAFEEGLRGVSVSAARWVSLAKGVDVETLETACEKLERVGGERGENFLKGARVLTLTGPSNARMVAEGKPCALVLAGVIDVGAKALQEALSGEAMRVYTSGDRRGAELGGALKNVFAVAGGICDGLAVGDNAKAGLLTRAIAEMARLGMELGGVKETFWGLTGVGDLMATSYGSWSRNRQLGERVARGEDPAWLVTEGGLTAEGYRTAAALRKLARGKGVESPILEQVAAVLHEGKSAKEAVRELMGRRLKGE